MILSAYGVCQGAPRRDHDLFDTHPLNPSAESWTIRRVSVSQQIPRCGVPRKGLCDLMGKPQLCGILGDTEMNDLSPVMVKHNQGIEDPKRRGRDNEHVDCHRVRQVVVQKAAPSRGGVLGRRGKYLPTVAWLTSMPSLSNSPWMRGAPQRGLAELIRRIRSRISGFVLERPDRRDRHRQ
jgi:hypothetical protein